LFDEEQQVLGHNRRREDYLSFMLRTWTRYPPAQNIFYVQFYVASALPPLPHKKTEKSAFRRRKDQYNELHAAANKKTEKVSVDSDGRL
jgi:hypothetical protein